MFADNFRLRLPRVLPAVGTGESLRNVFRLDFKPRSSRVLKLVPRCSLTKNVRQHRRHGRRHPWPPSATIVGIIYSAEKIISSLNMLNSIYQLKLIRYGYNFHLKVPVNQSPA